MSAALLLLLSSLTFLIVSSISTSAPDEVVIDFVADTGDGYYATFSVVSALSQPALTISQSLSTKPFALVPDWLRERANSPLEAIRRVLGTLGEYPALSLLRDATEERLQKYSQYIGEILSTTEFVPMEKIITLDRGQTLMLGGDLVYPVPTRDEFEHRLEYLLQSCLDVSSVPFTEAKGRPMVDWLSKDADSAGSLDHLTKMIGNRAGVSLNSEFFNSNLTNFIDTLPKDEKLKSSMPIMWAIPGNHDVLDGGDTFRRKILEHTKLAGWRTDLQRRPYYDYTIPGSSWAFFGLYNQQAAGSDPDIDPLQFIYFRDVAENFDSPKNLIIITHAPFWINEKPPGPRILSLIDLARSRGHFVKLFLAGDYHYYSHFESPASNSNQELRHLIVSGGGGAFKHSTYHIPRVLPTVGFSGNERIQDNYDAKEHYPSRGQSFWNSLYIPMAVILSANFTHNIFLIVAVFHFIPLRTFDGTYDQPASRKLTQKASIRILSTAVIALLLKSSYATTYQLLGVLLGIVIGVFFLDTFTTWKFKFITFPVALILTFYFPLAMIAIFSYMSLLSVISFSLDGKKIIEDKWNHLLGTNYAAFIGSHRIAKSTNVIHLEDGRVAFPMLTLFRFVLHLIHSDSIDSQMSLKESSNSSRNYELEWRGKILYHVASRVSLAPSNYIVFTPSVRIESYGRYSHSLDSVNWSSLYLQLACLIRRLMIIILQSASLVLISSIISYLVFLAGMNGDFYASVTDPNQNNFLRIVWDKETDNLTIYPIAILSQTPKGIDAQFSHVQEPSGLWSCSPKDREAFERNLGLISDPIVLTPQK